MSDPAREVRPAASSFTFRLRFVLPERMRIDSTATELDLSRTSDPYRISLRQVGTAGPLSHAAVLCALGEGYRTAADAEFAGRRFEDALAISFARIGLGADFGRYTPRSVVTEFGLRRLEMEHRAKVLNDEPGLMVYDAAVAPRFVTASVSAVARRSTSRFTRALSAARETGLVLDDARRLAFDFFSASFFSASEVSRLILLMMALEVLIDQQQRSSDTVNLVDGFIESVRTSQLDQLAKDSLVGGLRELRRESISSAGRALAGHLGDRTYLDKSAPTFFTACYSLRSRLVHGSVPRPPRAEVDQHAAQLERFVGDILAFELLDVELDDDELLTDC